MEHTMTTSLNNVCIFCSANGPPHASLCFAVPQLVEYKNVAYFAYAVQQYLI